MIDPKKILFQFLVPNSKFGWFSLPFTVAAVLALKEAAFEGEYIKILTLALQVYESISIFLLGWLHPIISKMTIILLESLGYNFLVSDIWRHIFTLFFIYFLSDFSRSLSAKTPVTGLFYLLLGSLVAFTSSALIALQNPIFESKGFDVLLALIPIFGFYIYAFLGILWGATFTRNADVNKDTHGMTWWQVFSTRQLLAIFRLFIGCLLVLFVKFVLNQQGIKLILLSVVFYLVFLSAYFIIYGYNNRSSYMSENQSVSEALLTNSYVLVGKNILTAFLWIAFVLLFNTGGILIGVYWGP